MDVKISPPLNLIEKARALQYANRSRIGSKEIQEKVKKRAIVQASQKKGAEGGLKVTSLGGQLEFEKKENYKIWTNRRRQSSGWLLIPSEDFVQNRLKGFPYSEDDLVIGTGLKYIGNAIEYQGESFDKGELFVEVNSVTIDPASDFTLEFLVRLAKTGVEASSLFPFTRTAGYYCPTDGSFSSCSTRFEISQQQITEFYSRGYSSSFDFVSSFYSVSDSGIRFRAFLGGSGTDWTIVMGNQAKTMDVASGKQYHVAFTVSGNKITSFFDGKIFGSIVTDEDSRNTQTMLRAAASFSGTSSTFGEPQGAYRYEIQIDTWERANEGNPWSEEPQLREYIIRSSPLSGVFYPNTLTKVEATTLSSLYYEETLPVTTLNSAEAGCGFSGLRLTIGDILYSGESFLPPESITSLV